MVYFHLEKSRPKAISSTALLVFILVLADGLIHSLLFCFKIRSIRRPWKEFDNSITQHDLYRSSSTIDGERTHYVDRLLKNMASLPVHRIEEMVDRGTQLKLILTLSDGTNVLFKPMR